MTSSIRGRRRRVCSSSRERRRAATSASASSSRSGRRRRTGWSVSRRRSPASGSRRSASSPTRRRSSRLHGPSRRNRRSSACSLANDIAAAAMEHCKLVIEPGMSEAQIAAEWEGFVHGEGTGWEGKVELALGLLARLVGLRHQDVHGDDGATRRRGRADALRDLGLRRRLLVRPHEEPRRRRAHSAVPRARAGPHGGVRGRSRVRAARGELRRARSQDARGDRGDRLPGAAVAPDLPRSRRTRARAAVRAPGRRRRDRGRHGACNRARMLYRGRRRSPRRGQLPVTGEVRRREASTPDPADVRADGTTRGVPSRMG